MLPLRFLYHEQVPRSKHFPFKSINLVTSFIWDAPNYGRMIQMVDLCDIQAGKVRTEQWASVRYLWRVNSERCHLATGLANFQSIGKILSPLTKGGTPASTKYFYFVLFPLFHKTGEKFSPSFTIFFILKRNPKAKISQKTGREKILGK